MKAAMLACLVALAAAAPASALTERDLSQVAVDPPAGAALPLALPVRGVDGRSTTIGTAADGRPVVFVFADYRCRYLCGPALSLTADALSRAHVPDGDYRLLILGLDPSESPAEAAAFAAARLTAFAQVRTVTRPLVGDAAVITAAAAALGYRYRYDAEHGQYAHMAAAFVLAPDGRLVATLSDFQIQPQALRRALARSRAAEGTSVSARLHALCYPFDPARGIYDQPVQTALRVVSLAGLIAVAGLVWRRTRRRGA